MQITSFLNERIKPVFFNLILILIKIQTTVFKNDASLKRGIAGLLTVIFLFRI